MHSVIETPDFIADAKSAGTTDAERQVIVTILSGNPTAGIDKGCSVMSNWDDPARLRTPLRVHPNRDPRLGTGTAAA